MEKVHPLIALEPEEEELEFGERGRLEWRAGWFVRGRRCRQSGLRPGEHFAAEGSSYAVASS